MWRGWLFKKPIAFICVLITISCILVMTTTILRLPEPEVPLMEERNNWKNLRVAVRNRKVLEEGNLGKLEETIINMLPEDLPFTVFLPSETAFERDLGLRSGDGADAEKIEDAYATLSRVMGFSTVPRAIYSYSINPHRQVCFDSLSGFRLCLSKGVDGPMIVNGVRSLRVDLRRNQIIVHIMDGVIMDAEFEQAVKPNADEGF